MSGVGCLEWGVWSGVFGVGCLEWGVWSGVSGVGCLEGCSRTKWLLKNRLFFEKEKGCPKRERCFKEAGKCGSNEPLSWCCNCWGHFVPLDLWTNVPLAVVESRCRVIMCIHRCAKA